MLKEYTISLREEEFDILLDAIEKAEKLYHDELRQLDCHTDEYVKACDVWAEKSVALFIAKSQLMRQR